VPYAFQPPQPTRSQPGESRPLLDRRHRPDLAEFQPMRPQSAIATQNPPMPKRCFNPRARDTNCREPALSHLRCFNPRDRYQRSRRFRGSPPALVTSAQRGLSNDFIRISTRATLNNEQRRAILKTAFHLARPPPALATSHQSLEVSGSRRFNPRNRRQRLRCSTENVGSEARAAFQLARLAASNRDTLANRPSSNGKLFLGTFQPSTAVNESRPDGIIVGDFLLMFQL
jgi:hypothetical protein